MNAADPGLPRRFDDVEALEDFMTRPSPALVADLAEVPGDIAILGVGGKMGPTLARLARRAAPKKRIYGIARFSESGVRQRLEGDGITCIPCDLLDRSAVMQLPDAENVVFMAGRKFGTRGAEHLTWAMNALVPAYVAERYAAARIVAFSTACVYPFVSVLHQGAREDTPALPPPGEYAWSCLARERVFEHWSERSSTPGRLIRLSYAIDLRYGVLYDVGRAVLEGQPVPLRMGHVNVIWQGDANAQALRALRHCTVPTTPLNVSGPEIVSIRTLAESFARRFGKPVAFTGSEAPDAWLVNTEHAQQLFGYPEVPLPRLVAWVAEWLERGGVSLGKDTHFEVREGAY